MGQRVFAVECFEPAELHDLRQTFDDVWARLSLEVPKGREVEVRDAIALALFDLARAGQRDRERLWCVGVSEGRVAIERCAALREGAE
jgi:hypothetical protein